MKALAHPHLFSLNTAFKSIKMSKSESTIELEVISQEIPWADVVRMARGLMRGGTSLLLWGDSLLPSPVSPQGLLEKIARYLFSYSIMFKSIAFKSYLLSYAVDDTLLNRWSKLCERYDVELEDHSVDYICLEGNTFYDWVVISGSLYKRGFPISFNTLGMPDIDLISANDVIINDYIYNLE